MKTGEAAIIKEPTVRDAAAPARSVREPMRPEMEESQTALPYGITQCYLGLRRGVIMHLCRVAGNTVIPYGK